HARARDARPTLEHDRAGHAGMTDRVLFVSREHGLARALAITLRRHRYAVESAAGVAAAVGALDVRHFAVVVVDVNGVKARAGALRTLRRATAAPLLALVAAAAGGEPRRAIDAGADDILEMPYSVAA